MESVHHLLDTSGIVPPVNIEQIDVGGPELLQGAFDGEVHGLHVVAAIQYFLLDGAVAKLGIVRVLGEHYQQGCV